MAASVDSGLFQFFTEQFSTNLELKLQQTKSLLRGKVSEKGYVGKMASPVNQVGAVNGRTPPGRFSSLEPVEPNLTRPWVFPVPFEIPQLIDTFDELQTIVDPKSNYVDNAAAEMGRHWDDQLIAAAVGTTQRGQDASALAGEAFPATFQIAASFGANGSAAGLTVDKIIETKRLFRKYHVEMETDPITLVIGSQQESDLLKQAQVVSTDFNDKPVLVDGRVQRFLGFDIIVSERLTQTTLGTTRGCLAFAKSGLHLGIWKDLENLITRRNDLSGHPYQIYTNAMSGGVRTQLGKVVQILCADTTGADITP